MKLFISIVLFAALAFGQTTVKKVTLTWTDDLNPAGTTYTVKRAPGDCTGTPAFVTQASALTVKTHVDQPVPPGRYCYQIIATADSLDSEGVNGIAPVGPFKVKSVVIVTEETTIIP